MNENDSKSEVNLESLLQQLKGESPKNAETPQVSNDIKLNFKQTLSVISDDAREKIASNLFLIARARKKKASKIIYLIFVITTTLIVQSCEL